jgi:tRNA nucleotidyltransferase (CCA-adding enzyme)
MPIGATPLALRGILLAGLHPNVRHALEHLIAFCAARGIPAYAVGGTIRDVLLDRDVGDVDLAFEGDAEWIAVSAFLDTRPKRHQDFKTATVVFDSTRLDLVTARSETYAHPGALPKVEAGSIVDDMRRRDFSVNAIALRLDGEPALIDPCGGIDDLRARRIRVLHDGSFRDDATRIFRAFRYAARLGLAIEPHTSELIEHGIQYVHTIGGERLRRELELLLGDEPPGGALLACANAGALAAIHKSLNWTVRSSAAFAHDGLRALLPSRDLLPFGFALMDVDASTEHADAIAERLRLKRGQAAAVRAVAALRAHRATLERPQAKPSGVALLLDRYPPAAVAAFVADNVGSIAGDVALRYLRDWRAVKPRLNGRDLQTLGVPEGPQVARGLQLIRAAKLDGWAGGLDDERALAMRFVKSIRDSSAMNAPVDFSLDDEQPNHSA